MVVESDFYKRVFPRMRLKTETRSECVTTMNGGRFALSVGGSVTGQVFFVQPLHHQDDHAAFLVVEPGAERAVVPIDDVGARRLRCTILGLERIVEDDEVRTPAGNGSADRQGEPPAAPGGDAFGFRFRFEPQRLFGVHDLVVMLAARESH